MQKHVLGQEWEPWERPKDPEDEKKDEKKDEKQ
jgi:hypothetical protein